MVPDARPPAERVLTLLMVDDNPHDRALLARSLRTQFSRVELIAVRDAKEFEHALCSLAFNAAVVDYQVRWCSGMDLFRRLREARPDCPVIMFTASGSEEIAVEAMKAGLDDYVIKSAKHYARLPYALSAAMDRAEQRRQLSATRTAQRALVADVLYTRQRLEDALRAARMVAWECELPGGALLLSPNAEEILESRWSTLRELLEATHPEDRSCFEQAFEQAVANGAPFVTEVRVRLGPALRQAWLELRAEPARSEAGTVGRIFGLAAEISERKQAELASAHLATIVASCEDAILSQTLEGVVTSWNQGAARLFGYDATEMIGQRIDPIIPADLRSQDAAVVARLARGERVGTYETKRISHEGRVIEVAITASPLVDARGKTIGVSKIIRDITEHKRIEEELRCADRRKDTFVATLAHELRNPLAPIRYATRLLEPGVPAEMAEDARRMIERQLAQMARLLDDLLDVSRVTRGILEIRRDFFDVRSVLDTATAAIRPLADAAGMTLAVRMPDTLLPACGDEARLVQVFGNLLNNAVKYGKRGGHVWVEAGLDDSSITVRVRDDGIGISREFLPKVFGLFAQAEPAGTRAAGGLGIGLSLARELVELHGGQITVRSDGLDLGSEFIVKLPRAAEQGAIASTMAAPEKVVALGASGISILIVDDNYDAANALARVLSVAGYQTRVAYDPESALKVASDWHPQAVLLDIGMPKISGHELARLIRTERWGRSVLLIAITGWGQEADRRRSLEVGFDAHLTKPVEPELLLSIIAGANRHTPQSRARDETAGPGAARHPG